MSIWSRVFPSRKEQVSHTSFLIQSALAQQNRYDRAQKENEAYLKAMRAEEDAAWSEFHFKNGKVLGGWKNYIGVLRAAYPDNSFFDSMPGFQIGFRKARCVLINADTDFRLKYRADLPKERIIDVGEKAIQYGFAESFPLVDPFQFNAL